MSLRRLFANNSVEFIEKLLSNFSLGDEPSSRLNTAIDLVVNAVQAKDLSLEIVTDGETEVFGGSSGAQTKRPDLRHTVLLDASNVRVTLTHDAEIHDEDANIIAFKAVCLILVEQLIERRKAQHSLNQRFMDFMSVIQRRPDVKDFHTVFGNLLKETQSLFKADHVSLWLVDEGYLLTNNLEFERQRILVASASSLIDLSDLSTHILSITDSTHPFARVATQKQPLLFTNIANDPNYSPNTLASKLGLSDLYSVPLLIKDKVVLGVVNVYTRRPGGISEATQHFVKAFAGVVAQNILEMELQEKAELLERISQVTLFSIDSESGESWKEFVHHLCACVGVKHAGILRRNSTDKKSPYRLIAGTADFMDVPFMKKLTEELIYKVPKGQIVRLPNFQRLSPEPSNAMKDTTLEHSAIIVPVSDLATLICANKIRPGCFDFLSGVEEGGFAHLGKIINVYLQNLDLLTKHREAEDSKDAYLQNLRHEIISPLDFILNDSDWLAKRVPVRNEQESRRLQRVRDEILENANIISMLAKGSNALDSNFALSPTELNLTEAVVRPLVKFFERVARSQSVKINWEFLGLPRILADRGYTMTVFYNVLRNALKYKDPAKKERIIDISSRSWDREGFASVIVSDNGIGIVHDDIKRIFEKYYRGENAKAANITGSGLGLAIAKNIMEKQGGRIFVSRNLGPTEFVLEFRTTR